MARGHRNHRTEARWRQLLARQRRSGLSVRAFCLDHGLSEPSFYAWRRTIRARDAHEQSPAFVPLTVQEEPGEEAIAFEWHEGGQRRVLRLASSTPASRVVELITAIEAAPTRSATEARR